MFEVVGVCGFWIAGAGGFGGRICLGLVLDEVAEVDEELVGVVLLVGVELGFEESGEFLDVDLTLFCNVFCDFVQDGMAKHFFLVVVVHP